MEQIPRSFRRIGVTAGRRELRTLAVAYCPLGPGEDPGGLIDGTYDLATARTAGFTGLAFTSLFTCFNARSNTTSAFIHLFVNPWLWGAVALSARLRVAVVNLDSLDLAFGTAPLVFDPWLRCVAMASVMLWFSELCKLASRAWRR